MQSVASEPTPASQAARIGASLFLIALALTLGRALFLLAGAYPLEPDEAQYWSYGKDLAGGYYSKPPLVAWIIRGTTSLFGDTEFGVRIATPFIHAAAAGLVWLSARRLFDPVTAFWSGLAYLVLPGVTVSAGLMTTDPPMLLAWAAGLYLVTLIVEKPTALRFALLGAVFGLGLLAKYTMVVFLPSLLLFLLLYPAHRARFRLAGFSLALLVAVAVLAPNLYWNAQHEFATIRHVGDNASLGGDLIRPGRMLEFLGAQFGVFGPILFGALLVVLAQAWRIGRDPRFGLLLCMTATLLVVILIQSLLSRAHANWAAASYVAGAILVPAWLLRTGRTGWLKAAIGVNLALVLAWPAFLLAIAAEAPSWPGSADPFRKNRAAPELGERIETLRGAWPGSPPEVLFDHRRVMATSLFYAGLPLAESYMWNPDGVPGNHYELVRDLAKAPEQPLLLVSVEAEPKHILARFERAEPIENLEIRTHPERAEPYSFWRLEGFRGYRTVGP